MVPHAVVKSIFIQQELGERRANWMTSLQEYDLEFKPSHTVKGHKTCKLTAEASDHQNTKPDQPTQETEGWEHEIKMYQN